MRRKALIAGICYILFVLFVYAGSSKLMAYSYFLNDLERSPVLKEYSVPLSIIIPFLELLVAGLLLFRVPMILELTATVKTGMLFFLTMFIAEQRNKTRDTILSYAVKELIQKKR